jgi:hypothetical protein
MTKRSAPTLAEHVPPELRIESRSSYLVHIRSRGSRHWPSTGTLLCNDASVLPVTPNADPSLPVCRRCAAAYSKESPTPPQTSRREHRPPRYAPTRSATGTG